MMNERSKIFDLVKLKELVFSKNILIIIGVLGIALIFLADLFSPKASTTNQISVNSDSNQYITDNEKKLKKFIEEIEGAGKCEVMITLDSGSEYIYATEKRVNQNTVKDKSTNGESNEIREDIENKTIVLNDSNGGEKPLIIKEIQPKIKGVAIICEGGDRALVKNRIIEVVTSLLDVPTNKVCVNKKS
jgi:stage III sporulation protein AG